MPAVIGAIERRISDHNAVIDVTAGVLSWNMWAPGSVGGFEEWSDPLSRVDAQIRHLTYVLKTNPVIDVVCLQEVSLKYRDEFIARFNAACEEEPELKYFKIQTPPVALITKGTDFCQVIFYNTTSYRCQLIGEVVDTPEDQRGRVLGCELVANPGYPNKLIWNMHLAFGDRAKRQAELLAIVRAAKAKRAILAGDANVTLTEIKDSLLTDGAPNLVEGVQRVKSVKNTTGDMSYAKPAGMVDLIISDHAAIVNKTNVISSTPAQQIMPIAPNTSVKNNGPGLLEFQPTLRPLTVPEGSCRLVAQEQDCFIIQCSNKSTFAYAMQVLRLAGPRVSRIKVGDLHIPAAKIGGLVGGTVDPANKFCLEVPKVGVDETVELFVNRVSAVINRPIIYIPDYHSIELDSRRLMGQAMYAIYKKQVSSGPQSQKDNVKQDTSKFRLVAIGKNTYTFQFTDAQALENASSALNDILNIHYNGITIMRRTSPIPPHTLVDNIKPEDVNVEQGYFLSLNKIPPEEFRSSEEYLAAVKACMAAHVDVTKEQRKSQQPSARG